MLVSYDASYNPLFRCCTYVRILPLGYAKGWAIIPQKQIYFMLTCNFIKIINVKAQIDHIGLLKDDMHISGFYSRG